MFLFGNKMLRIVVAVAAITLAYSGSAYAQLTDEQQEQLNQLQQTSQTLQTAANNQQAQVNQNIVAVNDAQAALNTGRNNVTTAQQNVTGAQTALTQALNFLNTAQASGTATAEQIAALQAAVTGAQENLTAQQAALTAANNNVTTLQQNLVTAQQALIASNTALTLAQTAAQNAAAAVNNFQNAIVQARLQAGNAAQNAAVGGRLTAGNIAQNANLTINNAINTAIRNASTANNVANRQATNAAYGQTIRSNGGESCATGTLGGMICNIMATSTSGVGIITGFAYIAGLICGFLGILKLRQHVESPNQVEIWDPIKRFVAGGAFFSLPYIANVVRRTIEGASSTVAQDTGFNGTSSGVGLDAMIVALMSNIGAPSMWIIGWFGWIAGLIFVFIGISRLMQTEQQGPKGPTGIGTVTTFLIAGCLFSLNSIVSFLNGSVFNTNQIATNGTLRYTDGLAGAADHIHAVISAIIMFSIVIGWVSLVRGLFIVRGVSEGNSQASMMAGITHLIGGILAVNLGSVIMAVQNTLGIAQYGITFQGAP